MSISNFVITYGSVWNPNWESQFPISPFNLVTQHTFSCWKVNIPMGTAKEGGWWKNKRRQCYLFSIVSFKVVKATFHTYFYEVFTAKIWTSPQKDRTHTFSVLYLSGKKKPKWWDFVVYPSVCRCLSLQSCANDLGTQYLLGDAKNNLPGVTLVLKSTWWMFSTTCWSSLLDWKPVTNRPYLLNSRY